MKELIVGKKRREPASRQVCGQIRAAAAGEPASEVHTHKAHKAQREGARSATRASPRATSLSLYINDEFFEPPREDNSYLKVGAAEAGHSLRGREPHPLRQKARRPLPQRGGSGDYNTLIAHIQAYLYQKGRVVAARGERLRPGAVQPHRPEHRRHSHRPPRGRRPCAS